MNNWKERTLGNLSLKITKGTTPTTEGGGFVDCGVNFIKAESISEDGRFLKHKFAKIDEDTNQKLKRSIIQEHDILFSIAGVIGRVALVQSDILPANTNQALAIIRLNHDKADTKFIYYFLSNKQQVKYANSLVAQSVQANINLAQLGGMSIPLPSLGEQKKIAAMLSSLDDKIELLRKQNETLEKIAQGIFKEWFVNFKVDGKKLKLKNGVPEGWMAGKLTDIADFLNGFAMQKFPAKSNTDYLPVIKIKEMNSGITDQTDKASKDIPEKYIVNNGDILFSWSGSLDIDIWKYGKGALNQHLFKVTSDKYPKWFYFYWIKYHLPNFRQIANAKAVTMGHIQRHHLDDAQVFIPDDEKLKKTNAIIKPIFEKTILNNSQIQTLSRLRDTLLPKLMSGEIITK